MKASKYLDEKRIRQILEHYGRRESSYRKTAQAFDVLEGYVQRMVQNQQIDQLLDENW